MLQGKRVDLTPFTPADITPQYVSWLNDPQVVRLSNQRFRRHDEASCAAYLRTFEGSDNRFFSIRLRESGQAIGTATAYFSRHHGTVDCGILLGVPTTWGKGLGQDAWDTLTDWCAEQPGIRKVTAGTLDCNTGMLRLMERSGLKLEATRKAHELVNGQPHDILLFARFTGH